MATATALESVIESGDENEVLRLLCLVVPEYVPQSGLGQSTSSPLVTTQSNVVLDAGVGEAQIVSE